MRVNKPTISNPIETPTHIINPEYLRCPIQEERKKIQKWIMNPAYLEQEKKRDHLVDQGDPGDNPGTPVNIESKNQKNADRPPNFCESRIDDYHRACNFYDPYKYNLEIELYFRNLDRTQLKYVQNTIQDIFHGVLLGFKGSYYIHVNKYKRCLKK